LFFSYLLKNQLAEVKIDCFDFRRLKPTVVTLIFWNKAGTKKLSF
jgi:hypothetical protein